MNKILTTRQAARILGLSRSRVKQLIQAGQLPATKHGRDYMINLDDLLDMPRRGAGRPRERRSD